MTGCSFDPYTLPTVDFVGGSTQDFAFNAFFFSNRKPFDMTQCTATFSVISYVNKDSSPLISKEMTVDNGADGVANVLKVTLDAADTVDLAGKYIYQVTVRDNGGGVDIPNQGILRIANNIDKAVAR